MWNSFFSENSLEKYFRIYSTILSEVCSKIPEQPGETTGGMPEGSPGACTERVLEWF